MYKQQHLHTTSTNLLSERDERAWEGQFAGSHWIARVVCMEEDTGLCGLHIATGAERDQSPTEPNCLWDYECDHFLGRFSAGAVPVGVTCEMLDSLRTWLANFRRSGSSAQHGASSERSQASDSRTRPTVRPGAPSRRDQLVC